MKDKELPIAFLRECFDYDPETGVLAWRMRPREHFTTTGVWKVWNARFAGKPAKADSWGYLSIRLTYNRRQFSAGAHRVAWALATGAWPQEQIDHRNGIRSDNRLANLRAATQPENSRNAKAHADNASGFLGVHRHKQTGRWRAQIRVGPRHFHLGLFNTPEAAHAAYLRAKKRLHSFQPIPRERLQ
jgi:hypothetical protein